MVRLSDFFSFGLRLDGRFPNERQLGARNALLVLTSINLLNFMDRYVPSAVKQLIIDDLHISDFESSLPSTGMIVVYMIFAVIFGYLSDRQLLDRRIILWGAVIFWSVATSLAGLSTNIVQLVCIRSLVGVGEAAYGTISPPMLSDFYPFDDRNVVYGIYYLAIPVGGAIGYGIGAILGGSFGWRIAFLACGAPGLAAAVFILRLNDPARGINDPEDSKQTIAAYVEEQLSSVEDRLLVNEETRRSSTFRKHWRDEARATWQELLAILGNSHFMFASAGLIASNFALGGLADWLATFLLRYDDISLDAAGLIVGGATIVGGLGGTLVGSKAAQYLVRVHNFSASSAYFLIPAAFSIPGAVCVLFAINITGRSSVPLVTVLLVIGQVCLWAYLAPISAISVSCIPPSLRARSCGVQIFLQHILGDIISPPIIGAISDATGSLQTGLQLTWIAVVIASILWFIGSRLEPIKEGMVEIGEDGTSSVKKHRDPTYYELLFTKEAFTDVDGRVVRSEGSAAAASTAANAVDSDGRVVMEGSEDSKDLLIGHVFRSDDGRGSGSAKLFVGSINDLTSASASAVATSTTASAAIALDLSHAPASAARLSGQFENDVIVL